MNFYRASIGESPSAAWRERTADSVRKYIFRKGQSKGLSFTPASPLSPCVTKKQHPQRVLLLFDGESVKMIESEF